MGDLIGRREWYAALVDSWFDDVDMFARLAFPFAPTQMTLTGAFQQALKHGPTHDAPSDRAWLYRLVRDSAYRDDDDGRFVALNTDLIRHSLLDLLDGVDDPDASPATRTVRALAELSALAQELIRLHTMADLELDELAWIVGVDPAIANEQLTTAAEQLRQLVDDHDPGVLREVAEEPEAGDA